MGRRIGQLAGLFAFVLAIGRLDRLFETGPVFDPLYPPWQPILLASAVLGGLGWWLLDQTIETRALKLTLFAIAGFVLAARVSAPETMAAGIIPTEATFEAMSSQLDLAFRIIRSGVPPVVPHPGLISVLAVVMWVVGALFSWGSTRGPYGALFLPPLVMYLQFAVFDRSDAGLGWLLASAVMLSMSVLALSLEHRKETGRARDVSGRPMGRHAVGLAVVLVIVLGSTSLALANNAAGVFDEYGNKWWGGGSGLGGGSGGGVQFDGLVDLRQRIINRSNTPLFVATVSGEAPPANRIYWRMDVFDEFTGEEWRRSDTSLRAYEPGGALADTEDLYQGTTYDFLQNVQINNLSSSLAPTAGVPIAILEPPSVGSRRLPTEFQAFDEASLVVTSRLSKNDTYQVRSVMPDRDADIGALATGSDGKLTPIFQAAAEAGVFPHEPSQVVEPAIPPEDLYTTYVALPEDQPDALRSIGLAQTAGASTDFERAWMLQAWFRDSGAFTYSTDVETGHDALVLADWLTDPTSPNHRTGYCEQFAAAMAVLARSLNIPSRVVWGFTPGTVSTQDDGNVLITVRDTNAHAWVEIWLDPYGWVQFDPTPRGEFQPPSFTAGFNPVEFIPEDETGNAILPSPQTGIEDQFGEGFGEPPAPVQGTQPRWWLMGLALIGLVVPVVPIVKRARRHQRLARVRQGDITAAWDEIVDRLTDLGEDVTESLTPIELAKSTTDALLPLALSYSSTVYGGRTGQATESDLIGAEWWIESNFDGGRRVRAALSPRSLFRRGSVG